MSDPKQNLNHAKFLHQLFKSRVRGYLDGDNKVSREKLSDHTSCELGRWLIKAKTESSLKGVNKIGDLESLHVQIHAKAIEIMYLKDDGQESAAKHKLQEVYEIGDSITSTITSIEEKIKS